MGNVPLQKLVGKGKENKLTKFQRQKLKYDFDTFFGKNLFVSTIFLCTRYGSKSYGGGFYLYKHLGQNKTLAAVSCILLAMMVMIARLMNS